MIPFCRSHRVRTHRNFHKSGWLALLCASGPPYHHQSCLHGHTPHWRQLCKPTIQQHRHTRCRTQPSNSVCILDPLWLRSYGSSRTIYLCKLSRYLPQTLWCGRDSLRWPMSSSHAHTVDEPGANPHSSHNLQAATPSVLAPGSRTVQALKTFRTAYELPSTRSYGDRIRVQQSGTMQVV